MRNQYLSIVMLAALLIIGSFNTMNAQTNVCYSVAEDNAAPNTLFVLENGSWEFVGVTGTSNLEAIAIDPNTGTIYAADAGVLGTIDPETGLFTDLGTSVGSGTGALGTINYDDIDGLSWDDNLGILWASQRLAGATANDLLLRIDPATGIAIGGAFAFGDDYVVIEEAFDGTLGTEVYDVDDIAWNPLTGDLYAIQNSDGPGIISIIDKFDGSLIQIVFDTPDDDLEGLGFDSNGDLYATSGDNGDTGQQNSFIFIDVQNMTSSNLGPVDSTGVAVDFESFDCYRAPEPTPLSGSLTADPQKCMSDGSAALIANHLVNPTVPNGYQVIYVLTSGAGLVIEEVASTPSFIVNAPGDYTIHTLVYDPNTLDLSIVVFGVTTGFDVNALLIQGGGTIEAALDVTGAPITVLSGNDPECICNDGNITQQAFPCYAVAEDNGAPNTLWEYDANSGAWTEIGITGTSFIEAIAANPVNNTLYATDAGVFGTINTSTGLFTAINTLGSGNGANGTIALNDVDGLTYDVINDVIWASHRIGGTGTGTNDLLFQIDPNTGTIIPAAFGGDDYVVVEEVFDGTFGADVFDVDDIALHPFTGELFAIQNQDGPGVISIINKVNGTVEQVIYDTPDEDLEGLGFDIFGNLFSTSGNNGATGAQNSFILIDYINGTSNVLGTVDPTGVAVDFESFDCFSGFHDLQITKSLAPNQAATVNSGDDVTFEITVTNIGQFVAQEITIEDSFDGEFSFVSGDFSLAANGNWEAVLDCALEPGLSESVFITLNATVDCSGNNGSLTLMNAAEIISATSFTEIPGVGNIQLADVNNSNDIDNALVIVNESALSVSSARTNETCLGNDGTISLSPDGLAPYTYVWSNGDSTQNITGLTAGLYSVTVTDANGCTETINDIEIIPDPPVVVTANSIVNSTCIAASGAVNIDVTGGAMPYTYLWSNGETTQNIMGLSAATYSVTVTDANGCSGTNSFLVENTDVTINLSSTTTDASCSGIADGAIDLTVSGGDAPYSYSWSNGDATEDISNIPSGSYDVTVTDVNGCTQSLNNIVVNEGAGITIIENSITNTNCGASSGAIDIMVSGGTAPYSYTWSNGAASEDISNLVAGTYTVTATDSNGCNDNNTYTVTNMDVMLDVMTTINDAACDIAANGSVSLTVNNGTAPYSYIWSNGETTQNISNLTSGNYGVIVTDADGCSESISGLIVNADSIGINTISIMDASCTSGDDGSISVEGTDGVAPYSYLWSNGEMTQTINGLTVGNYTVSVTDDLGCEATEIYGITSGNTNISLNPQIQNPTCVDNANGIITLNPANGQAPYTFLWSDGQTGSTISDLAPGLYSVTVTDANGCSVNSGNIQLVGGTEIQITGVTVGATDGQLGSVTINVIGGTPPYSYLWSNGFTSQNLTDVEGGSYTVVVTDAEGCTATETFIVDQTCNNCVFDLSLTKDLTPGQSAYYAGNVNPGDDVMYTITVVNQGDFAAENIVIADYVPTGMSLSAMDTNGWGFGGVDYISNTIPGVIQPGGSASIDVIFTVSSAFSFGSILNVAEIVSNDRTDGEPAIDIDSTPDDDKTNDFIAEDDYDNAIIFVIPPIPPVAGQLVTVSPICLENGQAAILAIPDGNTVIPLGAELLYLLVDANSGVVVDANTTPDFLVVEIGNYTVHTFVYDTDDFDPADVVFGVTPASDVITLINQGVINGDIELPGAAVDVLSCVEDLSLLKDLADGQSALVAVNETVEFTITVTNQGVFPMQNIQVIDYMPEGLVLAANNPGWTVYNGEYTYFLPGILEPGEEIMINIFFEVEPDVEGLIIDNFAEIVYAENVDGSPYNDIDSTPDDILGNDPIEEDDFDDASILTVGAVCNIAIADAILQDAGCSGNSGSVSLIIEGGSGSYFYDWSDGQATATATGLVPDTYSVTVTDTDGCSVTEVYTIEPGINNLQISGTIFDVTCSTLGGVNSTIVGGTAPYTYSWSNGATTANISGVPAGTYSLTATDALGCSSTESFTVGSPGNNGCDFDLALIHSFLSNANVIYNVGDPITYVITVTNQGDVVANNISIINYIPGGLVLNDPNWTMAGPDAVYTIPGTIPPGSSVAVPITFTIAGNCGMSIKTTSEITSAFELNGQPGIDVDSTPDNDEFNDGLITDDEQNNNFGDEDDHDIAVIFVECPASDIDLSLNKSVNPLIVPVGGTITYTITVNNSNLGDATGILVGDQLPPGVSYVSDNSSGAYNEVTGMWTIGTLMAGQSVSLDITCVVLDHSNALNTAQVMAHDQNDIDSSPGNDQISEDDQDNAAPQPPVAQSVDLALNKSVNPQTVEQAGDIVTWTIIVNNQSASTATGVTVSDNLPSGLTYMSDNSNGAYNSVSGIWTIGTVAPGANAVLQITTLISDLNNLTNYAEIASINEPDTDSNPGNNSTTEDDDDSATLILVNPCNNIINTCTQPITPVEICITFCNAPNAVITDVETLFNCSIEFLSNGCFEYTPLPGLTITDELTVTGVDNLGNTDIATVFVDIGCDGNLVAPGIQNPAFDLETATDNNDESPFKVVSTQLNGDVLVVDFISNYDDILNYQLISLNGKTMKYGVVEVTNGVNHLYIEDINIVTGLYIISLDNEKEIVSHKVLID